MKIPTLTQAEELIAEAERRNPGPWVSHSRYAGEAAQAIASHHPELDADAAFILGLLHDIGRYFGVSGMRHSIDGYKLLMEKGWDDAARVSMTHSFPIADVNYIVGKWDCTEKEFAFAENFIQNIEYTKYDILIQLCDCISLPTGHTILEKRIVDVALRYGTTKYSVPRWKTYIKIKEDFEKEISCSIYSLLPGVVENTFGFGFEK
ncbi:MAG: HDOD domain-containing protein [Chloroflexi bacterium]|nr:HDOD domain-containing protein [Chloroflexota bacterium]